MNGDEDVWTPLERFGFTLLILLTLLLGYAAIIEPIDTGKSSYNTPFHG